jgi:hypothetical protein
MPNESKNMRLCRINPFLNAKIITTMVAAALFLPDRLPAQSATPAPLTNDAPAADLRITMPGSPLGVAWGFLYGYLNVKPEQFMPQARQLGAGFTRVCLFWNQIEPQKGKYDWTAVDAFVNQLNSPDEGLISLFSSSQWAVEHPSALLPPSPAKNLEDYHRFVRDVVRHCKGKVRYWQNDGEPNDPIYWSGTKEQFVAQLRVFHQAVKEADPSAVVVVGGYDGLFGPPGAYQSPQQQAGLDFFDYVLKTGSNAFDVFDLHLYGNPYTIVGRVDIMRQKMRALGYEKPIICTEYDGPGFFGFYENLKYVSLLTPWTQSMLQTGTNGFSTPDQSGSNRIAELYKNMSTLAPETQMFLLGCSPELEAKYNRIQSRDLVMRNVFAFAAGVQKTLYVELKPFQIGRDNLMTLMWGKTELLDYENGSLQKRTPTADAYERMAKVFNGVRVVRQIRVPGKPSLFFFEMDRGARGPAYVIWERHDAFRGEDAPPVPFDWAWTTRPPTASDALGQVVPVQVADGRLHLNVSVTPIFFEPVE